MPATRHPYLLLSPVEKGIFYVLIFAALGYMAYQIFGRSRLWMKGQPISWKPDYLGGVWKYIIGQRKVQSSRPRDGAPIHMMIFYGFLALFIATSLLAVAQYGWVIGIPNFHQGNYYLAYETIFDLLGLLFVFGVGLAWLRRINETSKQKAGDKSATPLSNEWRDHAALALLFALGIGGYVLEAGRIVIDPKPWDNSAPIGYAISHLMVGLPPIGYKILWWSHAFLVMVFFAALPQMRLKHIVIATLAASGMDPEHKPGRLEPISMEEVEKTGQIGVNLASQFSRWHLMSLDACMSCGRCTEVCPAYNVGKELNPKQVVADIFSAAQTGASLADTITEEVLWQCTTCNACVEACPVLIKHVDMIVDVRRNLVAEGNLAGSSATMLRQMGGSGSAWGAAANQREDWMKGLDIPLARDGKPFEYLFWVGCAGATDPLAVRTTKAFAALLKKAGVSFACLGAEETCTGDPARRVGDEFMFQEQAGKNHGVFAKYGVKKVLTACPHCLNTLHNEYGDFGSKLDVKHHTQMLAELVADGKLKSYTPVPGELTYHDPCYLARINNISDAPRALVGDKTTLDDNSPAAIAALARDPYPASNLAEPSQHGKKTLCCGAGGGRMWMEEEPDQRPNLRRLDQLMETGAKDIAVACPFCRIMLDAGIKQRPDGDEIRLVDMAELLQEANS